MLEELRALMARLERYRDRSAEISTAIADCDDMFGGDLPVYLGTGRAAIEVIACAMLLARKTSIETVLDLPCGGGRVTRHLRAFLPEAEIYVYDIDQSRTAFSAQNFGAIPIKVNPDFSEAPEQCVDLVFVGSLLTHLDEAHARRALDWFKAALNPNGLAIITTGGRRSVQTARSVIDDAEWDRCYRRVVSARFEFASTVKPLDGVIPYGATWVMPSWVSEVIEQDPLVRIVAFMEAAWLNNQDCMIVQKRSVYQ